MEYILHYKDEATYKIEANSKEEAIQKGDEFWANRTPQVEVEVPVATHNRLEGLRKLKENAEMLNQAAEADKQAKTQALVAQIQALKPRIEELLATANACLENGIEVNAYGNSFFRDNDSYEKGTFVTNSISHKVGFVQDWTVNNKQPHVCTQMGINNGGACGPYHFRTDGNNVFSVHEKYHGVKEPRICDMENFLRDFDKFESSFYSYVDKIIEKQQRSVDRLIANAEKKGQENAQPANPGKQHDMLFPGR